MRVADRRVVCLLEGHAVLVVRVSLPDDHLELIGGGRIVIEHVQPKGGYTRCAHDLKNVTTGDVSPAEQPHHCRRL
jgi:hypothetical protein